MIYFKPFKTIWIITIISFFILGLCSIGWAGEQEKHKVAILPIQTNGIGSAQYIAPSITEFLGAKLSENNAIALIPPEASQEMAGYVQGMDRNTLGKKLASQGIEYFIAGWIEAKEQSNKIDLALIDAKTGRILLEYGPKETNPQRLNKIVNMFASRAASVIERKRKRPSYAIASSPVQQMDKINADIRNHPDLWFKQLLPKTTSKKNSETSLPPATNDVPFPPPKLEQPRESLTYNFDQQKRVNKIAQEKSALGKAKKRGWISSQPSPPQASSSTKPKKWEWY